MKRIIFLFLLISTGLFAQTGIGTSTPDASAKLEVNATNKGFLPPRVTLTSGTDNTTIPSPATGLLVYNTGNNGGLVAGYYYWNGSSWATIATASGSGVSASYLRGSRSSGQTTGLTDGGNVLFTQVDNVAGQEMSLNTSTGQITLAAGRTYRLLAQVPNFQTTSGETRFQLAWYNESSLSYIGSSSTTYPPSSGAAFGTTGGLSEAIITTTATTVVSYRIIQISNVTQIGGNIDFTATGSFPWFDIQVISGNAPFNQFNFGDVKTGMQSGDHNGWIKLDGRQKSTLSSSQQTQATALGFGTNLPNATNAFLVQNGSTLGGITGSSEKTITQANLPNVNLSGTTSNDPGHVHTIPFATSTLNLSWGVSYGGGAGYNVSANTSTSTSGSHAHTLTTSSINGNVTQTTLDITPKSLSINTFIYLGF
jgi:hypothetical protein